MDKDFGNSAPSVAATARKLVRRNSRTREILENCLGLVAVLILLIAVFSFATEHFFSFTTFTTIANQIPTAVLIAVGMTLVLIIAGIDLSVGSVLAVSGGVLGIALVHWHLPLLVAVLLSLLVGAFCGFVNGAITFTFNSLLYRHSWRAGSRPRRGVPGDELPNPIHWGADRTGK